ncbi:MAG: hypothetical protein Q8910_16940 [Bacteroidota bacterium]|nr:hypothetical protein [Bacteroidota bacterium]
MPGKSGHIIGSFKEEKKKIDLKLPFIAFEEDGCQIVYCPALDISGYGLTEQEANDSFKVSLESFLSYTINKNTLLSELRRLGWNVKNFYKPIVPPKMSKLLSDNENFSRIFNDHPFRKFDQDVEIPIS